MEGMVVHSHWGDQTVLNNYHVNTFYSFLETSGFRVREAYAMVGMVEHSHRGDQTVLNNHWVKNVPVFLETCAV